MSRVFLFLLIVTTVLTSCDKKSLEVKDNSLVVSIEVLTESVGYGNSFSARLFTSHKEISISNVECEYPIYADNTELIGTTSLSLYKDYVSITSDKIYSDSDKTITLSFTITEKSLGQRQDISCTFTLYKDVIISPKKITSDKSEIIIAAGSATDGVASVNLKFNPDDCNKDFIISCSSSDWEDFFDIRTDESKIIFDASAKSKGGNFTITVTSACNPFVTCSIIVKVRIDVALVIDGTSTGNLSRVTWNQYESYLFSSLYCYIANINGDIRTVMESATKESSSLNFTTIQKSFDYDIEFAVKRLQSSKLNSETFPYRCLSNANMALEHVRSHINKETDRRTCDDDTGYQYYTLMVNRMSYKSDIYRIRYIVHRYKSCSGGNWVACSWLSGNYKAEKNKYWYAAADTDQWIIEWNN